MTAPMADHEAALWAKEMAAEYRPRMDLRDPVRARLAALGWTHAELGRRIAALIGGDPDSRERTVHRFLTVSRPIYTDVYEAMLTVLDLTVTANAATRRE